MASRRYINALLRHSSSFIVSNPRSLQSLKSLIPHVPSLQRFPQILHPNFDPLSRPSRSFSSRTGNPKTPKFIDEDQEDYGEEEGETSDEDEEGEINGNEARESVNAPVFVSRAYSVEDKIKEAADIGYKVIGRLQPDDRVFKPYEPIFAVIQIGSHQFKVSNGDAIYVEKLKFCEVNDKLSLNKILMVGSPTQTIIGRPILPDAVVHAVVEEHALDAKVIIFKKKRRKNYRRTKGHRQELTRLRITDIQGVEKPETPSAEKTSKGSSSKKVEKVAVAA